MGDNTQVNAVTTAGDVIATDDIGGVKHQRVKVEYGDDGSATDVSAANPLPVAPGLVDPKTTFATAVSVAAGSSTDLDSDQISAGKTGKLIAVLLTASVALKGELHTVTNGAASAVKAVIFSQAGFSQPVDMPGREFFTVAQDAGAGLDGFRLTVTNLDNSQAADVYCTFFYDETT